MRSNYVGVEPYHLLILAHSKHKVTALLGLRRILKVLLGIRFLRPRAACAKQKKQKHCRAHDF